jgi:hypothetical protein
LRHLFKAGTYVMILKIFTIKKPAKKLPGFFTKNKAKLCENLTIIIWSLVFEKNAKFFAENCRKLWSKHRPWKKIALVPEPILGTIASYNASAVKI